MSKLLKTTKFNLNLQKEKEKEKENQDTPSRVRGIDAVGQEIN
jgi:hypothetical protein